MLNRNSDDSMSSEDEILKDALKEATDHEFLKDIYFRSVKSENSEICESPDNRNNFINSRNSTNIKPSRRNLESNEKFENFGVSLEFQQYVAKKLDESIEKSIRIKDEEEDNDSFTNEENTNHYSGIKLFNSSIEFLTTEKGSVKPRKIRKRRKIAEAIDNRPNLLKCKEVAVSPEWILSKVETKAWTNRREEPQFKYKKLKNGTLIEQT